MTILRKPIKRELPGRIARRQMVVERMAPLGGRNSGQNSSLCSRARILHNFVSSKRPARGRHNQYKMA